MAQFGHCMNSHLKPASRPPSLLQATMPPSTGGATQRSEAVAVPSPAPNRRRGVTTESLFAPRPPIAIMGVPFDNVTSAEALELVEQMIASRRPHYLVTANVDFLVQ